jgi:hypothetical protein
MSAANDYCETRNLSVFYIETKNELDHLHKLMTEYSIKELISFEPYEYNVSHRKHDWILSDVTKYIQVRALSQ